jgi:hypothetical protein
VKRKTLDRLTAGHALAEAVQALLTPPVWVEFTRTKKPHQRSEFSMDVWMVDFHIRNDVVTQVHGTAFPLCKAWREAHHRPLAVNVWGVEESTTAGKTKEPMLRRVDRMTENYCAQTIAEQATLSCSALVRLWKDKQEAKID